MKNTKKLWLIGIVVLTLIGFFCWRLFFQLSATENNSSVAVNSSTQKPRQVQNAITSEAESKPTNTTHSGVRVLTLDTELQSEHGAMKFEELKALAERGDAQSQRRLAEIYGSCYIYSMNPESYEAGERMVASMMANQSSAQQRIRYAADVSRRCRNVDAGQKIPQIAMTYWLDEAARNGDLVAKVRVASLVPVFSREDAENQRGAVDSLISEVITAGNVDALFEMEALMSTQISTVDQDYQNLSGSELSGMSWSIAACRLGSSRCRDPIVLASRCFAIGVCDHTSYESYVVNGVLSPADRQTLEAHVSKIIRLFNRERG